MEGTAFRERVAPGIGRQAVVDDFGGVHRHFFVVVEEGDQGVGGFVVEEDLALRAGVVAGGKGPDELFKVGDIDVVVDEDVFRRAHAGFACEKDFAQFAAEFLRAYAGHDLAPVAAKSDCVPVVGAFEGGPGGGDREAGVAEGPDNFGGVGESPGGVVFFDGFARERDRENGVGAVWLQGRGSLKT